MVFGDRRGGWGASPETAAAIVKRYAEAGGKFIDTANHYARGESERIVAEVIRPDRDRWVLATKYTLSADALHRSGIDHAPSASVEWPGRPDGRAR